MKKQEMLELGTIVKDSVSDIDGMLTIFLVDMSGNRNYLFQPAAINPETLLPVRPFWVDPARVAGANPITVELPLEVVGTEVEDKATGFKGTAIALAYHINGCAHFAVKAKGIAPKTGQTVDAVEFDIRRLKGPAIKELTKEELDQSKKDKPSPENKPELTQR